MDNQVHSEKHPIVINVEVFLNTLIEMVWNGRKVCIQFAEVNEGVHITEAFDADETGSIAMQKAGWQAILNNFQKIYRVVKE